MDKERSGTKMEVYTLANTNMTKRFKGANTFWYKQEMELYLTLRGKLHMMKMSKS